MQKRDKKLNLMCIECKTVFTVFVDSEAYKEYLNEENDTPPQELFPHLHPEELDLLETGICENCV